MTELLTELPKWFQNTRAGQEAVAEHSRSQLGERQRLAAEVARLNAEHEARYEGTDEEKL